MHAIDRTITQETREFSFLLCCWSRKFVYEISIIQPQAFACSRLPRVITSCTKSRCGNDVIGSKAYTSVVGSYILQCKIYIPLVDSALFALLKCGPCVAEYPIWHCLLYNIFVTSNFNIYFFMW